MRNVNIYSPYRGFIGTYKVTNFYEETFYHRKMPYIGRTRCKEILNKLYPHFKADFVPLIFEWDDDKYRGIQTICRNGTILNF